jgi:glycine cleavage system aminomethyltransferase T
VSKEHKAIRFSAAISTMNHVSCIRMSGDDVFEVMDAICPKELYLRDGQMQHTLLLTENASPLADVYVCCDDEDFIILAEGLSAPDLIDHITGHAPPSMSVDAQDLSSSHTVISVNGPYAWEILSEALGPEVVGMPYLSFYHLEDLICFRGGKTGEYGYDILVPQPGAQELEDKIREKGRPLDIGDAGLETLDQCALENWFFNIRREGALDLTPIELQLQWRISYRKEYVGATALAEHRQQGNKTRLTTLLSTQEISTGQAVTHEGEQVGKIVNAGFSHTREDWVGLALMDLPYSYPGLDLDGLQTVSPPVLHNRSMYVSPQAHSYGTRDETPFPPVVKK